MWQVLQVIGYYNGGLGSEELENTAVKVVIRIDKVKGVENFGYVL